MTILEISLSISIFVLLFFIFKLWKMTNNQLDIINNLENSIDSYEKFFIILKKEFKESLKTLKSYDVQKLFEGTDELGLFFNILKKIFYNLEEYFEEEKTTEENKK